MNKFIRHIALPAALLLLGALPLRAQSFTWAGLGADANWTTTGNFINGPATSNSDLVFTGANRTTANFQDNSPSLPVNTLTFDANASSFTLAGNPILYSNFSSGNFITNNSANAQTLAFTTSGAFGGVTLLESGTFLAAAGDLIFNTDIYMYNFGQGLTLTIDGAHNTTISGNVNDALGGTGSVLVKNGTGTLTFTGTSSYLGSTTINAGKVIVDGSIASADTFVNAGTLGGSGNIGGNVTNSGLVSPGDSPGTLTLGGNYTQNSGGSMLVEIAGLAAGQHDLLAVGGAASLNGNLQVMTLSGFKPHAGDTVTFLTAGSGVSGTFSSVTAASPTIISAKVIYDPNDAMLLFYARPFVSLPHLTPNQASAAHNLDLVAAAPGGSAALINFLDNEPLGNLPHDFDLISPEELTAIFEISRSFADIQASNIENHLTDVRDTIAPPPSNTVGLMVKDGKDSVGLKDGDGKKGVAPVAPEAPRWNLWLGGSGDFVRVNSDGNGSAYHFTTAGVTIGADYRVCDHFVIGLMGGYANTGATLTQGGSVDVDSGRLGIYTTTFVNDFYVNTLATGGYNSYDTHRLGLGGIAQGTTDGAEFDGLISTGYDLHSGNWTVGPVLSAQYTYVGLNGFTEAGSLAPLNFPSQHQDSLRSKAGFKVSSDWNVRGVKVTPSVTAGWQHEYLDSSFALDSQFASGAGGIFRANGPKLGRDSVVVNAGVTVQWTPRIGTYLYYDGELGRKNYQLNSVSGGVKWSF